MKKTIAMVLCAAMTLTACGGGAAWGYEGGFGRKAEAGTFHLWTERGYFRGRGICSFEQEFNCEIVTETGGTNDRYTKLAADSESSIDVIELSQAMTAKGIEEGLFEDIDLSKIENASDMIAAAKTMADAGQGVAYTINSIGIMYNPEAVDFEIKGFDDLWDSRLEGMVSILKSPPPWAYHGIYGKRPCRCGY